MKQMVLASYTQYLIEVGVLYVERKTGALSFGIIFFPVTG